MKKLLFLIFGILVFSACQRENAAPENQRAHLDLTKQFSKSFLVTDKSGNNQVQVKISSDYKSDIEDVSAEDFILTPRYEPIQEAPGQINTNQEDIASPNENEFDDEELL